MRLRYAAAALALASAAALPATMRENPAVIEYQIGGGSLGDALTDYARLSRRQLLYPSSLVAGRTAPPIRGRFTADEALSRLLAGTDIRARRTRGNSWILVARQRPAATQAPHRQQREIRRSRGGAPIVPVQPAPSVESDEPIIVTGSNIRRTTEGPSPVQVIGREAIERAGQGSVAEAIAALPQNFGGTGTEDTVLTSSDRTILNNGLGSSANLRGLGSDATLTLVNGRRVAGSGGKGDFSDLSLIPLAAVDRIEVLTDGASAIYGSDAVGGVINILLRPAFEGAESRLRIGTVTQGDLQEVQFGQVIGAEWSSGSVIAAYEYSHRDSLDAADRDFARTGDLRPFGGSDWRTYISSPGTIVVPTANGLVPSFAIPAGQDGTNLTPSDFLPGANLTSLIEGVSLLPRQTRHSGYVHLRQELRPGIELFAEGRYGHRRYFYWGPASLSFITATPANPYFVSPDGSPSSLIAYSFIDEVGPSRNAGRVEAWSATAGGTADIGGGWSLDAYVSYAEERTRIFLDNQVNATYLAEAAGSIPDNPDTPFSTARDGFFNPYGDGRVNGQAVLDFVNQGYVRERIDSGLLSADLKVDGRLFDLPGGSVRAAFGAALRRELFFREGESFLSGLAPRPGVRADSARTVTALFGEVIVPLVGVENALPGLQRLELSGAVRHERYNDFGSSTNPRLGIIWEPMDGLRLRGSWGTSFRAPALREVNDPVVVSATQLRDASNTLNIVLFLSGGNPDLGPERAETWTVGAQFEPARIPGLRGEVTFFQTRFDDRIGQPAFEESQIALRDNALSPFVTPIDPANNAADRARVLTLINTPGADIPGFIPPDLFRFIVDGRYVNTAQVVVRGIDALVAQRFRLFGGNGTVSLNASYLLDYQRQSTPAAPLVERVDRLGNPPDLKLRLSGSWDRGPWGFTATVNHIGAYRDDVSRPERRVDPWTTLDAQIRYRPAFRGWLDGLSLGVSVQNLFDTDPPFVNRNPGQAYDSTNADPLGRFVAVQLIKSW